MSTSHKRYLIQHGGKTLGSNADKTEARKTAEQMGVDLALAILDSRTLLVVDRVTT